MTKPLIGIFANQRLNTALDNIPWTYVPTGFAKGVEKVGGIPLVFPMTTQNDLLSTYVQLVDKLILIGGQNIDPKFYGQEKDAFEDDYSLERDLCELKIIALARQHQKPLFTVCRGTQLVNVALGGNLHQDIVSHWQSDLPHVKTHQIAIEQDSLLGKVYGQRAHINSYHRQAIDRLADGLRVVARAVDDQTIEAVESSLPNFRFLGVQWHPELLHEVSQEDERLFDYVVNQL
ncbi:gamma-glutamyl-gamma-aminobutyrate hydrolase family protein [Streptococcus sp. E24BD]|uniref:gamma-glutamyl-gamma-aminobutyrate hydrolase family protein n=1 Tax=Streptococcus sp. E24BD TaxID=3278715 RepID=UPI00359D9AE0